MKNNMLYLLVSVFLSSGRNITSKKIAADTNKKSQFFLLHTILFASAALLIFTFHIKELGFVSATTLLCGTIYGVLLILSQWLFTLALKNGKTSVCSVVYSLGFLLPTVSGSIFWNEPLSVLQIVGLFVAVAVIFLAAKKNDTEDKSKTIFFPFILIAMVSSGGLGIMQKVQQSSEVSDEIGAFLLIAFLFAFICSAVAMLLCRERVTFSATKILYPVFTGLCFGGANLCNTILAGRMKSAVFFPLQNIATILFSTLLGLVIFKEKLTLKVAGILILGITVIVLFSTQN